MSQGHQLRESSYRYAQNPTSERTPRACRILIVAPDLGTSAALSVTLGPYVYIDTAGTASEALHRLALFTPDVILLDVSLPDLDGVTFLRALSPRMPPCAILVLTPPGELVTSEQLSRYPVAGLLQKPLVLDALMRRLNALLHQTAYPSFALPRLSPHVSHAIEYISAHYREPLTAPSIAKGIGVSYSHLAHLFRTETGMTIMKHLAKVRVEVAKHLLQVTGSKLENVAELVGFCDASHFSRVFRRHAAARPGAYRRHSALA